MNLIEEVKRARSVDEMQKLVLMQDEEVQRQFAFKLYEKIKRKDGFVVGHHHHLSFTDWQDAFVETLKQLKRL